MVALVGEVDRGAWKPMGPKRMGGLLEALWIGPHQPSALCSETASHPFPTDQSAMAPQDDNCGVLWLQTLLCITIGAVDAHSARAPNQFANLDKLSEVALGENPNIDWPGRRRQCILDVLALGRIGQHGCSGARTHRTCTHIQHVTQHTPIAIIFHVLVS